MDEKQIQHFMKKLDITREEAIEIIKDDEAINEGEKLFELTAEQKAVEKKMKNTGSRKLKESHDKTGTYNWKQNSKKRENPTKEKIISELSQFLPKYSDFEIENCEITNKTRQIAFNIGQKRFELTLVEKRPPKK